VSDIVKTPSIVSPANPQSKLLVEARFEVQRNYALKVTFEEYKGKKDLAQELANALVPLFVEKLEASEQEIRDVARYLADEYLQVGDSLLIIDPDTGKAIATFTEEDFWDPPDTARSDGRMVSREKQLRPELQGFLVRWKFDKEREQRALEELAQRIVQMPSETGVDRRLLATTRNGRTALFQSLRASLDTLIPNQVRGSLRGILDFLEFGTPTLDTLKAYKGLKAYSQFRVALMDPKSRNLYFDIETWGKHKLAFHWAREVIRTISLLAHQEKKSFELDFPPPLDSCWVVTPDLARTIHWFCGHWPSGVVAVDGAPTLCVRKPLGHIVLGKTSIVQREVHDRWEVAATLDYDLYLNLDALEPYTFTSVPIPEVKAEVVR